MKLLQMMYILIGCISLPIKIRVSTCEYITLHNKIGFACLSTVTALKRKIIWHYLNRSNLITKAFEIRENSVAEVRETSAEVEDR